LTPSKDGRIQQELKRTLYIRKEVKRTKELKITEFNESKK